MNEKEWDVGNMDDDWDDDDWDLDADLTTNLYDPVNDLSGEMDNGQRVRDLRMLIEMSPEALADYAMISVKELLAIEAGILQLNKSLAQQLANGIGVGLTDIWVEHEKAA